jgi:hypothetical protein
MGLAILYPLKPSSGVVLGAFAHECIQSCSLFVFIIVPHVLMAAEHHTLGFSNSMLMYITADFDILLRPRVFELYYRGK